MKNLLNETKNDNKIIKREYFKNILFCHTAILLEQELCNSDQN